MNDNNDDNEDDDEDLDQCMVCGVADEAGTTTIPDGQGTVLIVHWRCIAALRQLALTNLTSTSVNHVIMNPPQQSPQGRPVSHGRLKEQKTDDYVATPAQQAGATARIIIRDTGLDDTAENWKALKRAYLAGYADASRR